MHTEQLLMAMIVNSVRTTCISNTGSRWEKFKVSFPIGNLTQLDQTSEAILSEYKTELQ